MTSDAHILTKKGRFGAWQPAAWLHVSGEDAAVWLQGQISNDLRKLETAGAVYGLWLNHKGRVVGDGFVGRADGGGRWIGSYFTAGAALRTHLEGFIVADDVAIADATEAMRGVTLLDGAEAEAPAGVVVFPGRRGAVPATEWVFPAEREEEVRGRLAGWTEVDAVELERRRIAGRIPAVPRDIGPGDLPNEGGLDEVAISYTKGCYLGQEVMARLKHLGQVRRCLVRVRGAGPVPAGPAELEQEGRKAGELRSAAADGAGWVGLALVTRLNVRGDAPLRLASGPVELLDAIDA